MQAVILFAHGSRDPLWQRPIERVAARLQELAPDLLVRCAYLELTAPSLEAVVAELAEAGTTQLQIVPMFLGIGRHAREDLPALTKDLQAQYPGLKLDLRPAVGEMEAVVHALAMAAMPAN